MNQWVSFAQIHVQHATGDQAAGEDEETKSAADDPVFQSVHDSGPGGWLRGRLQGLESPFPLGRILHWTLSAGKDLTNDQIDRFLLVDSSPSNRAKFSRWLRQHDRNLTSNRKKSQGNAICGRGG